MLIDLHATSPLSGGAPLDKQVAAARELGLDGICVVDRDASGDTARAVANGDFGDFPVFVGVELETRSGAAILIVPEMDPVMTREEWREVSVLEKPDVRGVVELAERLGGVVLLSHPYDRHGRAIVPGDGLFAMGGLSGIEIGTGRADKRATRTAVEAIGKSRFPAFGGSNGRKGASWLTLFAAPVETQADLVEALRSGDFWPVELSDEKHEVSQRRGGGRRRDSGRDGGRDGGRGGDRRGGRGGGGGGRGRGGRSRRSN